MSRENFQIGSYLWAKWASSLPVSTFQILALLSAEQVKSFFESSVILGGQGKNIINYLFFDLIIKNVGIKGYEKHQGTKQHHYDRDKIQYVHRYLPTIRRQTRLC